MDPDACLRSLLLALRSLKHNPCPAEDRSFAADYARSLADWLDKGGFPPKIPEDKVSGRRAMVWFLPGE